MRRGLRRTSSAIGRPRTGPAPVPAGSERRLAGVIPRPPNAPVARADPPVAPASAGRRRRGRGPGMLPATAATDPGVRWRPTADFAEGRASRPVVASRPLDGRPASVRKQNGRRTAFPRSGGHSGRRKATGRRTGDHPPAMWREQGRRPRARSRQAISPAPRGGNRSPLSAKDVERARRMRPSASSYPRPTLRPRPPRLGSVRARGRSPAEGPPVANRPAGGLVARSRLGPAGPDDDPGHRRRGPARARERAARPRLPGRGP